MTHKYKTHTCILYICARIHSHIHLPKVLLEAIFYFYLKCKVWRSTSYLFNRYDEINFCCCTRLQKILVTLIIYLTKTIVPKQNIAKTKSVMNHILIRVQIYMYISNHTYMILHANFKYLLKWGQNNEDIKERSLFSAYVASTCYEVKIPRITHTMHSHVFPLPHYILGPTFIHCHENMSKQITKKITILKHTTKTLRIFFISYLIMERVRYGHKNNLVRPRT